MTSWELSVPVQGLTYQGRQRSIAAAAAVLLQAGVDPYDCARAAFERDIDADTFAMPVGCDADVGAYDRHILARRPNLDFAKEARLLKAWDDANSATCAVLAEEMGDAAPKHAVLEVVPTLSVEEQIERQFWIDIGMAEYRRAGLDRSKAFAEARADWEIVTSYDTEPEVATNIDAASLARETIEWLRSPADEVRPAFVSRADVVVDRALSTEMGGTRRAV